MTFSVQWPSAASALPTVDELHLWRINLDENPGNREILSPDEQERAQRFVFEEHRKRFIAARSWLRQTLGAYLQTPPEQIAFVVAERGKPAVVEKLNPNRLCFNLSHSAQQALLAVTLRHEVGVDIQDIQASKKWQEIAERWFTAAEWNHVRQLPEAAQSRALTEIWTRKEAVGKALGEGLSTRVFSFAVGVADWGAVDCGEGVSVWSLPAFENFAAAVAVQKSSSPQLPVK